MTDPAALQPFIRRPKKFSPHKIKTDNPERVNTSKWHTCDISSIPHPRQFTDIFINDRGDRLYRAQDTKWAHPYWASLKAESLVDALAHVPIDMWIAFRVPYENEAILRLILEKDDTAIDYLVIREGLPSDEMVSWFFINQQHQKYLERIPEEIELQGRKEVNHAHMKSELGQLLKHTRHHNRQEGRWSPSSTFDPTLQVAAAASIIERAENGYHPACEGIEDNEDFLTRLAAYLKADKCVLQYLDDWRLKLEAVRRTGCLDTDAINELTKKVTELETEAQQWKHKYSYPGLPCDYAERDREEGREITYQYQLWSLSRWKDPYQPSSWELELPVLKPYLIRCPSHWETMME